MHDVLDLTVTLTPPPADRPDAMATIALRCEGLCEPHSGDVLVPPLTEAEREGLDWYLEEYWRWPFLEFETRGKAVEASLEAVGQRLYEALFDSAKASRILTRWEDAAATQRRISIVSAMPAVLSLPWELLHDGQGFLVLKVRPPVSIVRRFEGVKSSQRVAFEPIGIKLGARTIF